MSVIEFVKAIADNGITIVVCAIALWVLCRMLHIIFTKIETKSNHNKHDKLIKVRSEIGEEIQILLDNFISKTDGESIQVVEFSNSVTSIAYLPFRYMTCTYESCKLGMMSKGTKIDKISTSLFTPFFNALQYSDYCIFDIAVEEPRMGGAMYDLMKSLGETKSLCAMLCTTKGKAVGYVSFQKQSGYTDEDIQELKSLANQLSALLCVVDR